MRIEQELLNILADGCWHDSLSLERRLRASAEKVAEALARLQQLGLRTEIQDGQKFRILSPPAMLDEGQILGHLPAKVKDRARITTCLTTNSTNQLVLQQSVSGDEMAVCVAEHQSEGRGRRGRTWVSPFAANLYFSLATTRRIDADLLGWVSLGSGLATVRSLETMGYTGIGLKWPNDLVVARAGRVSKLGGVLIEMTQPSPGQCKFVIGIGVNVKMPEETAQSIDQAWTDLRYLSAANSCDRNRLVALMIGELDKMLLALARGEIGQLRSQWQQYDVYQDQNVSLLEGGRTTRGRVGGIDEKGRLVLRSGGKVRAYGSGEISLRGVANDE